MYILLHSIRTPSIRVAMPWAGPRATYCVSVLVSKSQARMFIVIVIIIFIPYGKFSTFQVCFCGLDPGNLKSETVRTHKRHVRF